MRRLSCIVVSLVLLACSDTPSTTDAGQSSDAAALDVSAPLDASTTDVDTEDASAALSLGTLTVTDSAITCPKGAAPGASCMSASVTCPNEPDITLTLADVEPAGTAIGTVIAHDGGSGTGFYNGNTMSANAFSKSLTAKNYRFVQVAWNDDWASTGKGIKRAGCRPATVFRWVYDHLHTGGKTAGFCGMGASGGTAAMLYSIAAYGLKDLWDYLQLAAGPTPARIDVGCDPASYQGGPRNLCPQLTNAPYRYDFKGPGSSPILSIANGWEGTSTCGAATPPANDVTTWASDSLLAAGNDVTYPQTSMSFWYCVTAPNMSTGQGSFFVDAVKPKDPADVNCYSGTCQNEEVFEDGAAFDLAVTEMVGKCVPNH